MYQDTYIPNKPVAVPQVTQGIAAVSGLSLVHCRKWLEFTTPMSSQHVCFFSIENAPGEMFMNVYDVQKHRYNFPIGWSIEGFVYPYNNR